MKKNFTILIVLAVVIFIVVIVNMNNSFDKEMEEYRREFDKEINSTPKKKTVKTTLTDNDAAYAAQQFVEKRLKVPSSADFDALFKSKVTRNGKEYTVVGHVESQNSFGAKVRSRYIAVIKRNSTGGVSLLDLVIE